MKFQVIGKAIFGEFCKTMPNGKIVIHIEELEDQPNMGYVSYYPHQLRKINYGD